MPGNAGRGTTTQMPVEQMSTSALFDAIQEIEARYLPHDQVRELQPYWERLQQLVQAGDTG